MIYTMLRILCFMPVIIKRAYLDSLTLKRRNNNKTPVLLSVGGDGKGRRRKVWTVARLEE